MRLSTLRRQAAASAAARSHRLRWHIAHGEGRTLAIGTCARAGCGMQVTCNTRPLPNDIAIGGEAVALNCTYKPDAWGVLPGPFQVLDRPLPWQRAGLSQTASGYGARLTSTRVVKIPGDWRTFRIYVTIFSNSGTAWIRRAGKTWIVRDSEATIGGGQ